MTHPAGVFASDPEFAFLVACCREGLADSEVSASCIEWPRLQQLAERHKLIPRIWQALRASDIRVPDATFAWFRERFETCTRQALAMTGEMLRIVEGLASAGVETLPYKGPVLAYQLYGDVAFRQFGDIDLFVRKEDVSRARAALMEMGYEAAECLSPQQEQAYIGSASEYVFHGAHGRNLVELHWRVTPRFYAIDLNVDNFFERAVTISLGGSIIRTLCPEDLFLVLCIHAAKHAWNQLSYLCDITQMATSLEINWRVVTESAADFGIQRIMAITFQLARQMLHEAMPKEIEEWLETVPVSGAMIDRISRAIVCSENGDAESARYFHLMLSVRERRRDRARFISRLITTAGPGEWESIQLPEKLFSFYRAVRICRLARRFAGITS